MPGGGGGAGPAFGPAPFLLGGVGAAKGLLPYFVVPKANQPRACTLALWSLKFGPTGIWGGGGCRCVLTETWQRATLAQTSSWCGISREEPAVAQGGNN